MNISFEVIVNLQENDQKNKRTFGLDIALIGTYNNKVDWIKSEVR